jgi:ADP-ribose pyrophosphatase
MKPWKTLSKEIILKGNKFLTVEKHVVELPDGRIISDWHNIITPDFISVLVLTKQNKFLIVRQKKYAVKEVSLAPIGGYIEPNEIPLDAAKRELMEETGFVAEEWISLGDFVVDSNRGCGNANFFLATKAEKVAEPNNDDLEEQEILFLTREELENAITRNDFKVVPWLTNVLLSLRYLDNLGS